MSLKAKLRRALFRTAEIELAVLEQFDAPRLLNALRLPMPVLVGMKRAHVVVYNEAGAWRWARVEGSRRFQSYASLAFATLPTEGHAWLAIYAAPDRFGPAERTSLRRRCRALANRAAIDVQCNEALPFYDRLRLPFGAPEQLHVLEEMGEDGVPVGQGVSLSPDGAPLVVLSVERWWREGGSCFVQGWFHAFEHEIAAAWFVQDAGQHAPVAAVTDRGDVRAHYPMIPDSARLGFSALLPHQGGPLLAFAVRTAGGEILHQRLVLPPQEPDDGFAWGDPAAQMDQAEAIWTQFCREAIDTHLDVLEVGSRVVAMGSVELRDEFREAGSYLGMDVHPGPGVDEVGDVHSLSQQFGAARFGAIFSSAVMEHLATPWIAAAEMNRALKLGGIVFHRTHQCWPIHEQPNDFFRFSDEALAILFGPLHGFEVIKAGMAYPMASYPRDKTGEFAGQIALNPTYGQSYVLARKVAEFDVAASPDLAALAGISVRYPYAKGRSTL